MIEIKRLHRIEDFKKLVKIQANAWGFLEAECEPHHLMVRVQKYGGLIQGLFLDGELIGFTYGVIGKWENEFFIYSHMLAVIKEYQNRGFGFLLKKAQREETLKMGYDVLRWNFDPLESLNSYFNLHRLGVISVEYDKNIYGEGESGLHKGLPTDRLIAMWNLRSERVVERIKKQPPPTLEDVPSEKPGNLSEKIAYIEVPKDIRSIKERDMKEAYKWRMKTRDQFESAIKKGYVVEEVVFSKDNQRTFHKLRRSEKET